MSARRTVTIMVDASTGPRVSIGQKVKEGEITGFDHEGKEVLSPVKGKFLACQFEPSNHSLCLFIEEE